MAHTKKSRALMSAKQKAAWADPVRRAARLPNMGRKVGSGKPLAIRFERKLSPPDQHGCRLWKGFLDEAGYGGIRLPAASNEIRGRKVGHHVAAFFLKNDRLPFPGLLALHKCGVKACGNGEHIYEGTYKQNSLDYWATNPTTRKQTQAIRRKISQSRLALGLKGRPWSAARWAADARRARASA